MKKFISIILSGVLMFSVPAFGEEEDYTSVLEKVKEIYNIGDYEDFTYNSSDGGYNFIWEDEENSIRMWITKDLELSSYYDDSEITEKENTISPQEAQTIADDFLKKATADKYSIYKLDEDGIEQRISSINYHYVAYIGDVKILNSSVNICVSLKNGKVVSYDASLAGVDTNIIEGNIVDKETAKNAFLSDENMELIYKGVYKDEKYTQKPIYTFKNNYVDALTGEVYNYELYSEESADMAGGGGSAASSENKLSAVEIAEIEKLQNAVSVEDGIKLVEDKFGVRPNIEDINAHYYKVNDGYELRLGYSNYDEDGYRYSATINPDKEITYFYCGGESDRLLAVDTNSSAFGGETTFISGYDEIKDYVNSIYPQKDFPKELVEESQDFNYYDFYGDYKGIKVEDNSLTLTIDENLNVVVIRYYKTDDAFIEHTGNFSKNEVFNYIENSTPFILAYKVTEKGLLPVYCFEESFSIDANTGEYLYSNGSERRADQVKRYTDVDGTWYGEMANILINMGYYYNEEEFKGDSIVTGSDLVTFFTQNEIELYRDNKNSLYYEFSNNPDKEVTKYQVADFLVESMGYSAIADNAEFVKPFEDVDNDNIGNVSILKALGIAKGESGSFNGSKAITRAELAAMTYYMLLN